MVKAGATPENPRARLTKCGLQVIIRTSANRFSSSEALTLPSLSPSSSFSASIPQRFLCLCYRAKLPNSFRFRWPYVLLLGQGWRDRDRDWDRDRGRVQGQRVGFNDLRRRPRFNNIFCCFFPFLPLAVWVKLKCFLLPAACCLFGFSFA